MAQSVPWPSPCWSVVIRGLAAKSSKIQFLQTQPRVVSARRTGPPWKRDFTISTKQPRSHIAKHLEANHFTMHWNPVLRIGVRRAGGSVVVNHRRSDRLRPR